MSGDVATPKRRASDHQGRAMPCTVPQFPGRREVDRLAYRDLSRAMADIMAVVDKVMAFADKRRELGGE